MKILFDLSACQPIGDIKFHGGGIYGYIIFKTLVKKASSKVIALVNKNKYLPNDIKKLIDDHKIDTFDSTSTSLTNLYQSNQFNILYSPLWSNEYKALFPFNIPIICTFHGLRVLEMNTDKNELLYTKRLKSKIKALLKLYNPHNYFIKQEISKYLPIFNYNNLTIITVSKHSKYSLLYYFPFLNSNSIKVYYSPNTTEELNLTNYNNIGKYYLIVSANRWLKNGYRAILALDTIFSKFPDMEGKVAITGIEKDSFLLKNVKNKDRFITFSYLERKELEKLYKYAYALIYPSLNEGFGYPPLEAMHYGVPVIASSFASISEICGEAPLYVNPYSIEEMGIRILELENKEIYQQKKELSKIQYEKIKHKQEDDLDKLTDFLLHFHN